MQSLMKRIKRFAAKFGSTPFHPQWFALRNQKDTRDFVQRHAKGTVLDIGCAGKMPANYLSKNCYYIGLDYFKTSRDWYETRPDLYGDAQRLPIASGKVDTVLLLDVLEHLPGPGPCIAEISRVLGQQGKLIMQVPFIYPIHDAPLDFHRWTAHGLIELGKKYGFKVEIINETGEPLETAALLTNIATSKTVLNWIMRKNPAALLVVFLPFLVLVINVMAWLFCRIAPTETMMPISYRLLLGRE